MIEFPYRHLPRLLLLLCLAAANTLPAGSVAGQLSKTEAQDLQREARLVVDLLQNYHYSGRAFREMDSAAMVARFLSELDPQAEFIEAGDAEYLNRRFARTLKSVYLFRGDLQPAFEIFDRFASRAETRFTWVQARLDRGFDFTVDEAIAPRKEPVPFKTSADADRYWELRLKAEVLRERLRGRDPAAATAEVKRHYARAARSIAAFDPLTVRERFFDAIIRAYDPHSGYFSSDSAREFALEMEKAVVGLGVELRKEEGRCLVTAVQSGGPAEIGSGLEAGDTLEAIAEGNDGAWVQLDRLRLREIVARLRGKAGSKLRIAYRHPGQPNRIEETLERSRVELADDRARGAVSQVPGAGERSRRIGWIQLPSFYAAGEDSALSSSARDVRELLGDMHPDSLDGLVLDLRGNPGGALTEAVALSEIFLPRGIMMLSRGTDDKIKEHTIKEGAPLYTGPLVVLISFNSASASEVFSGAMRYHRRAVIVGAPASFGKGTVQAYIELAKMAPTEAKDWGTLRVTTERFFQPDGSSVQRTGVNAHVVFPVLDMVEGKQREVDLPGSLPVEQLPTPAALTPACDEITGVSPALVTHLKEVAEAHTLQLPEWQLRRDEFALWQKGTPDREWPLVEATRQEEWSTRLAAWHQLTLRRRSLITQAGYGSEPVEIAAARKLLDAEDARLRAAPAAQTTRTTFVVTTDRGHERKLDPGEINFARYVPDAPTLASMISPEGGKAWSAAAIAKFLQDADLLRYKTPGNLEELARTSVGADVDAVAVHRQLTDLLRQIATLDGELLRERPALDIELREALRLAAAWADWKPSVIPTP